MVRNVPKKQRNSQKMGTLRTKLLSAKKDRLQSRKSLRAGTAGNLESGGIPPDKTVKRFKRTTFSVTAYTDVRLFCQYKQTVRPVRERRFDSGTGQERILPC
ncbi:hypothetical protein V1L52_10095 [Treponema sp. HNW]|uniref:hypothetical protein n=1 Tax=Treponema sp. HNW TaxID=3116654 RepID=UPI003D108243